MVPSKHLIILILAFGLITVIFLLWGRNAAPSGLAPHPQGAHAQHAKLESPAMDGRTRVGATGTRTAIARNHLIDVHSEEGGPIRGAVVTIKGLNSVGAPRAYSTDDRGRVVINGVHGTISLAQDQSARYRVSVSHDGFATLHKIMSLSGDRTRLVLVPVYQLLLQVSSIMGKPLAGVKVACSKVDIGDMDEFTGREGLFVSAPTDGTGRTSFAALPRGDYFVDSASQGLFLAESVDRRSGHSPRALSVPSPPAHLMLAEPYAVAIRVVGDRLVAGYFSTFFPMTMSGRLQRFLTLERKRLVSALGDTSVQVFLPSNETQVRRPIQFNAIMAHAGMLREPVLPEPARALTSAHTLRVPEGGTSIMGSVRLDVSWPDGTRCEVPAFWLQLRTGAGFFSFQSDPLGPVDVPRGSYRVRPVDPGFGWALQGATPHFELKVGGKFEWHGKLRSKLEETRVRVHEKELGQLFSGYVTVLAEGRRICWYHAAPGKDSSFFLPLGTKITWMATSRDRKSLSASTAPRDAFSKVLDVVLK